LNTSGLVVAMSAAVFALRLGGLVAGQAPLRPEWERALQFAPLAALSALIVVTLAGRAHGRWEGVIAGVGAAVVARRSGRMWACILSGMAVYWLLRRL